MMKVSRKIILFVAAFLLFFSGSLVMYAQADKNLDNIEKKIREKEKEKSSVHSELGKIESEIKSLNEMISANKAALTEAEKNIANLKKRIEAKKEEIVVLQNRILARKDIMKQRLVALQHDNKLHFIIEVLTGSRSFSDLIDRASALSTLYEADRELLDSQMEDMKRLEMETEELNKQQEQLLEEQNRLKLKQEQLAKDLEKKEKTFREMQEKLQKIRSELKIAEHEKAAIEAKLKEAREKAGKEKEAAQKAAQSNPAGQTPEMPDIKGKEFYVVATAYSHEENGSHTALGYNIRENPHMKLIAVDPRVIPLGSKVWVEGYGVAIAGDTGGAIKGYRIDVLMLTRAEALKWGRKTVKVVVLE